MRPQEFSSFWNVSLEKGLPPANLRNHSLDCGLTSLVLKAAKIPDRLVSSSHLTVVFCHGVLAGRARSQSLRVHKATCLLDTVVACTLGTLRTHSPAVWWSAPGGFHPRDTPPVSPLETVGLFCVLPGATVAYVLTPNFATCSQAL